MIDAHKDLSEHCFDSAISKFFRHFQSSQIIAPTPTTSLANNLRTNMVSKRLSKISKEDEINVAELLEPYIKRSLRGNRSVEIPESPKQRKKISSKRGTRSPSHNEMISPAPKPEKRIRSRKRITKKVSFERQLPKIHKVWHINDIEDHSLIWYTEDDLDDIRNENIDTIHDLRHQYPENEDCCYRGLRNQLPLAWRIRKRKIVEGRELVLKHQHEERWAELAKLYGTFSRHCRIEAHAFGLQDAQNCKEYIDNHEEESTKSTSSRED